ncbi:MAG TPA: glycosyltransferase [Bacteroidales bacterium]|jgi:mannosyltransferase OCH1-like enzyme|nr:glycosyltransferase [Bacteroidales bacterium]HQI44469.1 glycosyltransferase [Bacteroidales bacterium]
MTFKNSMFKCNSEMQPSDRWEVMEKAYNDYYLNFQGDKTPKIPKIIHQIWLGSPFPDKYKKLTDIWREKHPDWAFLLWTEKEIEEFGLVNKWMYDNMRNPSAKSDIVRYEVAYSYGGIYIDTDFYCCKNFEDLLYLDFFCGLIGSYDGRLVEAETCAAPGIFACSSGNKLVGQIIQNINKITVIPRTIPEIMTITGPEMFSRNIIAEMDKHSLSVVFPPNFFFPFPGVQRQSIRNLSIPEIEKKLNRYIYPETYAMHLWYCSWQEKELFT